MAGPRPPARLALALAALCSLLPGLLQARTHAVPPFNYALTAPDDWRVQRSGDASALRLRPALEEEVTLTIRTKVTNGDVSLDVVTRRCRAEYAKLKDTERDLTLVAKPQETALGRFTAYLYTFRFRNFIEEVMESRTVWVVFPAANPGRNVLAKMVIEGKAASLKAAEPTIQAIMASFVILKEPAPPVEDDQSSPTTMAGGSTVRPTAQPTRRPAPPTKPPTRIASRPSSTGSRKIRKGPLSTAGVTENARSLFSDARQVTDEAQAQKIRSTFGDRDVERTEEEQMKAIKYFGGFRDTDLVHSNEEKNRRRE